MVAVNGVHLPPLPQDAEAHVAVLTGRLLEIVRQTLLARDWDGLRNVHFRVLSCVPPAGATHTHLAASLFMTKQAVGQFVTQLETSGHLEVTTDPRDRRRRAVRRTSQGDRVVQEVNAAISALEQDWRDLVGADRYQTFCDVLGQISAAGSGRPVQLRH